MSAGTRFSLVLFAACLACGKTPRGGHDADPSDAAADVPRDLGAAGSGGDLASDASVVVDAPRDSKDTAVAPDAQTEALAETGVADATSDAPDADDPRCADPGPGACVCDGFVMPNPPLPGLPNPARYELVGTDQVLDDVTGLVWERSPSTMGFAQPDAVTHCLGATTGGHGTWRLPAAIELVSIHDFSSKTGLVAPFPGDPFGETWSSTNLGSYAQTQTGFVVAFASQYQEAALVNASDHLPARCVRTGGAPPPRCYRARYALDSTDVATDRATGLVWRRHIQTGQMDWNTAKTTCAALGGGWRLPSLHELQTIVDHSILAPSIDAVTFPGTPPEDPDAGAEFSPFWTSSASAFGGGQAWIVDFVAGYSWTNPVATLAHARCVR